jgi:hypothetical protein
MITKVGKSCINRQLFLHCSAVDLLIFYLKGHKSLNLIKPVSVDIECKLTSYNQYTGSVSCKLSLPVR